MKSSPPAPAVCLCVHAHQPYHLAPYEFFDVGRRSRYERVGENERALAASVQKRYSPALRALDRLTKATSGRLKFGLAVSGVLLDQFEDDHPQMISLAGEIHARGSLELLGETYYHSLAPRFSIPEFIRQARLHRTKIDSLFGVAPAVFRDASASCMEMLEGTLMQLGFRGMLADDVGDRLSVARPALLAPERGILATELFDRVMASRREVVTVDVPLDLSGEGNEEAVATFWGMFVDECFARGGRFLTPSEAIERAGPAFQRDQATSEVRCRDTGDPWLRNTMQREAASRLFELEGCVLDSKEPLLIHTWSKLQDVDHFRAMDTSSGKVQPLGAAGGLSDDPHGTYLCFVNVLADLSLRVNPQFSRQAKRPSEGTG